MATLFELRVRNDVSQTDLGIIAGVGAMTVNRAERGKRITRENFLKICRALNVDPSDLEGVQIYSAVQNAALRARNRMERLQLQRGA